MNLSRWLRRQKSTGPKQNRSRLFLEQLEGRVNPVQFNNPFPFAISEVMFSPGAAGAQYVEIIGTPNLTLPNNLYFVAVNGGFNMDGTQAGQIVDVIPLTNVPVQPIFLGPNGHLFIGQAGSPYSIDPGANTIFADGMAPNTWNRMAVQGMPSFPAWTGMDFPSTATYFLITSNTAPAVMGFIDDLNVGGPFDLSGSPNWTIIDSVSVSNGGGFLYGQVNYLAAGAGASVRIPGAFTVQTTQTFINSLARTGTNQGQGPNDWLPITLSGTVPGTLAIANTFQPAFIGGRLNHFGANNFQLIGDTVFLDSNLNGFQDDSDTPLGGITVRLLRTSDNSVVATTVTDNTGFFGFFYDDINAVTTFGQNFIVEVMKPTNFGVSPQDVGGDVGDSDIDANGRVAINNVLPTTRNLNLDGGLIAPIKVVSIVNDAPPRINVNTPVIYTVTFDQPVAAGAFTANHLVNLGTSSIQITSFTQLNATTFQIRLLPINAGTLQLAVFAIDPVNSVPVRSIFNSRLAASVSDGERITVNNAPVVTSIQLLDETPTNKRIARFQVNFSEAVTGIDLSDFLLAATGVSGATLLGVGQISSSSYLVAVNTGSIGNGTIRLDVVNNGTITDLAGIPLGGSFNLGPVYTIVRSLPNPNPNPNPNPTPTPVPVPPGRVDFFAVGAGNGLPVLNVYNANGTIRSRILAYNATFTGGFSVATGDVTGDGVDDIITGVSSAGSPHVKVFNGANMQLIRSFFAFDARFTGGVSIAVGDVNGDGKGDIIVGAGVGGAPHVKVFDSTSLAVVNSFFAYTLAFTGGVRVSGGDTDGDRISEVVTAPGRGGGPHVKIFKNNREISSFFALDSSFTGGLTVATGDTDGDGRVNIIVGAGPGTAPIVYIFNPNGSSFRNIFIPNVDSNLGLRVATVDSNRNGLAEVLVSPGFGTRADVRLIDPFSQVSTPITVPVDSLLFNGVFVG
jgi:hypothetical protein